MDLKYKDYVGKYIMFKAYDFNHYMYVKDIESMFYDTVKELHGILIHECTTGLGIKYDSYLQIKNSIKIEIISKEVFYKKLNECINNSLKIIEEKIK